MKQTRVPAALLVVAAGLVSMQAASKDVVTKAGFAYKPNFGDYYPPASRAGAEQGMVKVRLCYDVTGKVQSSDVAESSGFVRLDEAAVRAGRDVVFKPGTLNGVPVADCVMLPVKFSLMAETPPDEAALQVARASGKKEKNRESADLTFMPDIWSYYPRESREAGEEGTAVVVVCYDTKGKVTNSELHSSSGFDRLDDAAIRASRKIRLDPPIRDSVPQAGCGVVPFKFSKKR